VLRGLDALHLCGIVHRDIKSANILLFENGSVKITDFNVSVIMLRDSDRYTNQVGTPYYSAPEVWKNEPYA
jgi:NIMA (never in mitosis gene a)-related kinase 1/4/5